MKMVWGCFHLLTRVKLYDIIKLLDEHDRSLKIQPTPTTPTPTAQNRVYDYGKQEKNLAGRDAGNTTGETGPPATPSVVGTGGNIAARGDDNPDTPATRGDNQADADTGALGCHNPNSNPDAASAHSGTGTRNVDDGGNTGDSTGTACANNPSSNTAIADSGTRRHPDPARRGHTAQSRETNGRHPGCRFSVRRAVDKMGLQVRRTGGNGDNHQQRGVRHGVGKSHRAPEKASGGNGPPNGGG
ncbi:MAG: hypothetical protein WC711_02660 [Candidatus Staskawiczbacteria bacterium]|jgi:hypothetical protein